MTTAFELSEKTDLSHAAQREISTVERLGLIGLMDRGMRLKAPNSPIMGDLYEDLTQLVDATISGSKINLLSPREGQNGFKVFELNTESGENLGRLDMLYLKKPVPCYYLVYVEVAPHFRKNGLGNRILEDFRTFLDGKSNLGILDNIIPKDDPAYSIYFKNGWEPVHWITGKDTDPQENYMVYVPPKLRDKDLKEPVIKLLSHLKRKRPVIEMRDNEAMVKRTITEFKDLHESLMAWFESELENETDNVVMRYLFTRFVTKLITFRRRIGELIGYTGGESVEQIELAPEVASMPVHPCAPDDMNRDRLVLSGNRALCFQLIHMANPEPARFIESLPDFRSPNYNEWLELKKNTDSPQLTLGDLMELGFDPSRLKEIEIDGTAYILERVRERKVPEIEEKTEILERLAPRLKENALRGTRIRLNPPLLTIQDRGNAYVLSRRIDAIHWEEAREQLQSNDQLKEINSFLGLDRKIVSTVRRASRLIIEQHDIQEQALFERLSWHVSWDLEYNRPGLYMDFSESFIESLWLG